MIEKKLKLIFQTDATKVTWSRVPSPLGKRRQTPTVVLILGLLKSTLINRPPLLSSVRIVYRFIWGDSDSYTKPSPFSHLFLLKTC